MVRRPAYLTAGPAVVAVVAVAAVLAGCGASTLPTPLHAAPEPAVAPPPAGAPAGTVVHLDAVDPEGVVVDASSHYAVVATRSPDRLLVVNTSTLAVVGTISGPQIGAARHLELAPGGEDVLVPGEDINTITVASIPAGSVVSSVKVGHQPHDATDIDGTIVVADELAGEVTATRGDTSLTTVGGLYQPGGVTQSDGLAAVVDVRGRLLDVYAINPLHLVGRVAIGAGPTHTVGLGDGTVAVADTTGGAILIVRVTGTPKVLASIPVPDQPYGLAVDLTRHRLWVASSGDDTLRMFTLGATGTAPTIGPTYVTVQQPNSLAVVPSTGDVIVAGSTAQGTLQEIVP